MAVAAVVLVLAAGCSSSKKNSATTTSAVAATTTTVATGANTLPTTGAPASGVVTIKAGLNDPAQPTVAVLQYMPAKATVAVGQKVQWTWQGTEPHSVTFLAPGQARPSPSKADPLFPPTPPKGPIDGTTLVNSGLQPLGPVKPPAFVASFSKPGTYKYICVIHPQMTGTITVVAGSGADTAAAATARGDAEQQQWLAEGEGIAAKLHSQVPASVKNADGTTTWKVQMGASGPHTDVLAFAPVPLSVKAGDKVTFINTSGAPHTATFFGTTPPILSPQDAKASTPVPGPLTLDGLFNSGLLPPDAPPGAGPPEAVRSYSFVVPKAGTYKYVCILHASSGMAGLITAT